MSVRAGHLCAAGAVVVLATGVGGCRRQAEPGQLREVWVRRDALRTLHPVWAEVQRLDALSARAAGVADPAPARRLAVSSVALPPRLSVAPTPRAPDMAPGPHLADAAAGHLESHRRTLRVRSEQRLAQLRREAEADVELAVVERRKALATRQTEQEAGIRTAAARERRELEMREIVLDSRVKAMTGPAVQPIEEELRGVRARIAAIDRELPDRLAQVRVNFEREEADYRGAEMARVDARMAAEARQAESEVDATVAGYREQLLAELAELAPQRPAQQRRGGPVPRARMGAPGAGPEGRTPAPDGNLGSARAASLTALAAQRARMVAAVDRDIEVALGGLATQRRWRLADRPRQGVPDATSEAASALRERLGSEFSLP